MVYFSNGTEGMSFEERVCVFCHHYNEGQCPVLTAHFLHNDDQHSNEGVRSILDMLISRSKPGEQATCHMYHEKSAPEQQPLF